MAAVAATSFSFIPASTFMTEQQMERWTHGAHAVKERAPAGLQKQYDTQIKLFRDLASAEGEYVAQSVYDPSKENVTSCFVPG